VVTRRVVPLYRDDTTAIRFTDIKALKKDWFKNRRWMEPFGWILIGPVLGVAMLPIAAIDGGSKAVKEWAIFEGVLLGIAGPPIFIGTRKTKYNLTKKWSMEVAKDSKAPVLQPLFD
jgi:hypothetical protein